MGTTLASFQYFEPDPGLAPRCGEQGRQLEQDDGHLRDLRLLGRLGDVVRERGDRDRRRRQRDPVRLQRRQPGLVQRGARPSTQPGSPARRRHLRHHRSRVPSAPTPGRRSMSTAPPASSPPGPTPCGNTTTYSYTSGVAGCRTASSTARWPGRVRGQRTCPAYGAAHVTGTTTSPSTRPATRLSDGRRRQHHHLRLRIQPIPGPGLVGDRPGRHHHSLTLTTQPVEVTAPDRQLRQLLCHHRVRL